METARLELQNIALRLGDSRGNSGAGRKVLHDISFELGVGKTLCLLGPSGCGKSSTLRVMAGIERQSAGRVLIDGEVIADQRRFDPPEVRRIGMMFQDFALFPHMNVLKNVSFSGADQKSAEYLLDRVGLADRRFQYPHELSGGEQQRVALARALAAQPRILLMDEPFSGLNDRLRDQVRENCFEILSELGTSVVMVTHDPAEAMMVADHIVLMRDGRIVQAGAPYHLYNNPIDKESASFFSNINVISGYVKGGMVETPFGQFLTPACNEGELIEFVIRPQHFKLDFDRNGRGPNPTVEDGVPALGRVARARFLGRESLVEFKMDFEDVRLHASIPGVFLPQEGQAFWLSVRRDRVHMFNIDGHQVN